MILFLARRLSILWATVSSAASYDIFIHIYFALLQEKQKKQQTALGL